MAPNAILPAPDSGKKKGKKDKKDKGKYDGRLFGGSPLHRAASSLVAGGESTKEGSLLGDEHASVDDLLSDLGSIQQVEDEIHQLHFEWIQRNYQ